jgi:hypothetical protein
MNSPPFDLHIQNYTLPEIEKLFGLHSDQQYKREEIERKEYRLREQLLQSGHVPKQFKGDLISFLREARQWLTEERVVPIPPGTTLFEPLDKSHVPPLAPIPSRNQEINVRQDTPFVYTQPSQYFQGIVNPLDKRIIVKTLAIDTKFRPNATTTSSTDFHFVLPDRFTKVVSMQLTALEIPQTYYNVSNEYGNSFFTVTIETTIVTIVVPDGYYTSQGLIDTIQLQATESGLFTCTLDGTSKKVTLQTNLTTMTLDFGLNQPNHIPHLGWMMGFTQQFYSASSTYVSEMPIQVDTISYAYLSVDDYNNNMNNGFTSAFTESVLNTSILARVSLVHSNTYTMIVKEETPLEREYFGPVDIQKLHIRLFDSWGRILNLNQRDFSFCLTMKMLYDL